MSAALEYSLAPALTPTQCVGICIGLVVGLGVGVVLGPDSDFSGEGDSARVRAHYARARVETTSLFDICAALRAFAALLSRNASQIEGIPRKSPSGPKRDESA